MGLPVNDKNKNKAGNKNQKNNQGGSKFIAKPGTKGANTTRPQRTGGTRGS